MTSAAVDRLHYQAEDFKFIQAMMHKHAGINLHDGKKELVYSRLAKRIRGLGFHSFRDYCELLDADDHEILHCINFMTTNVTSFFRESHHFEFLEKEVYGQPGNKHVRIWSAGCSSGEEPYSIAFTAEKFSGIETEVLATDLDSNVITRAQRGVYQMKDVAGLNDSQLRRWFMRGKSSNRGLVRVKDRFREQVNFDQLNLKSDWEHPEPCDVIFCRNVMIYFDNEFRAFLLQKFYESLKPGGYLMLGHSESLFGLTDKFRIVGKTIHQRKEGAE